jgi:hypothetical protein
MIVATVSLRAVALLISVAFVVIAHSVSSATFPVIISTIKVRPEQACNPTVRRMIIVI